MAYRFKRFRRTGRRYFKRPYISKRRKMVRRMMSKRNASPETKYVFGSNTFVVEKGTIQSAALFPSVIGIPQGTGKNQRIGGRVRSRWLTCEFIVQSNHGNTAPDATFNTRMLIVSPRVTATTFVAFMQTVGMGTPINPDVATVYYDKWHVMANSGDEQSASNPRNSFTLKKYIKYPRIINFTNVGEGSTTDQFADPKDQVYVYFYNGAPSGDVTVLDVSVSYRFKLSFIDV